MRRSGFPGLFVSLYNWHNPKANTSGGAPYGVTWEEMRLKPWEDLEENEWVASAILFGNNGYVSFDICFFCILNYLSRDGFTVLEGSDTLNASIKNESPISRVKYVNNNSILTDTEENQVFKKFINFVDHMLLFYSLDSRDYEGFMNGSESIAEGIVNSGKVKDFEKL